MDFVIGLVVGGLATYVGFRYFSEAYSLGRDLIKRADGDFFAAYNHVKKYAKGVVDAIR